jgi:hypothetical protein
MAALQENAAYSSVSVAGALPCLRGDGSRRSHVLFEHEPHAQATMHAQRRCRRVTLDAPYAIAAQPLRRRQPQRACTRATPRLRRLDSLQQRSPKMAAMPAALCRASTLQSHMIVMRRRPVSALHWYVPRSERFGFCGAADLQTGCCAVPSPAVVRHERSAVAHVLAASARRGRMREC